MGKDHVRQPSSSWFPLGLSLVVPHWRRSYADFLDNITAQLRREYRSTVEVQVLYDARILVPTPLEYLAPFHYTGASRSVTELDLRGPYVARSRRIVFSSRPDWIAASM